MPFAQTLRNIEEAKRQFAIACPGWDYALLKWERELVSFHSVGYSLYRYVNGEPVICAYEEVWSDDKPDLIAFVQREPSHFARMKKYGQMTNLI